MPLFLRALPLSLMALWHYVFLLPLVVIVVAPFMLLALIPLVGLPVTVGITTFISFAGYRCALAGFGQGSEPSFDRLIKFSLLMGILNALVSVVLMATSFAIGWLLEHGGLTMGLRVPALFNVPFSGAFGAAAYMVLISLFSCAMAVPMTAVAHSATPRGRDVDPFYGFGTGIFSLLIAAVVGFGGLIYLGFAETILSAAMTGLRLLVDLLLSSPAAVDAAATAASAEPVDAVSFDWLGLAIAVVYALWCTCWFCATAVLAWDRRVKRKTEVELIIAQTPKHSAEDLRALRESRMRDRHEQV